MKDEGTRIWTRWWQVWKLLQVVVLWELERSISLDMFWAFKKKKACQYSLWMKIFLKIFKMFLPYFLKRICRLHYIAQKNWEWSLRMVESIYEFYFMTLKIKCPNLSKANLIFFYFYCVLFLYFLTNFFIFLIIILTSSFFGWHIWKQDYYLPRSFTIMWKVVILCLCPSRERIWRFFLAWRNFECLWIIKLENYN